MIAKLKNTTLGRSKASIFRGYHFKLTLTVDQNKSSSGVIPLCLFSFVGAMHAKEIKKKNDMNPSCENGRSCMVALSMDFFFFFAHCTPFSL